MNKVKLFESYDVEETEREVNKFLKNLEDTGLGYFMDLKVSTSQGNGSLTISCEKPTPLGVGWIARGEVTREELQSQFDEIEKELNRLKK